LQLKKIWTWALLSHTLTSIHRCMECGKVTAEPQEVEQASGRGAAQTLLVNLVLVGLA